jgi:biopolymer transport protein ExbD
MVLTIAQEGIVFFNDERITLAGLSSAFAEARHRHPDATLLIEADRRIPYSQLVEIYNTALQAGIHDVALATRLQRPAANAP